MNWQLNLHVLSVLLLISLCKQALSLIPVSYQMCALSPKQVIVNLYQIIACLSFMHVRISLWTSYFQTCFTHFIDNSILNLLQPGFSPGDTTVNQLTYLYNTCTFSQPFFLEMRYVYFLWHKQGFWSCLAWRFLKQAWSCWYGWKYSFIVPFLLGW